MCLCVRPHPVCACRRSVQLAPMRLRRCRLPFADMVLGRSAALGVQRRLLSATWCGNTLAELVLG